MATQYTAGITNGQVWSADIANTIGAAWETFTPVWSSSGTQPAINNGTLTGTYTRIQKLVIANYTIQFGTTTTYGTGTYRLSFPITAKTPYASYASVGFGRAYDLSANVFYLVNAYCNVSSTTTFEILTTTGSFSNTSPVTWAVADDWRIQIIYEAA